MLTPEKVSHIADLAKLSLSEEEGQRYASELSKVVEYIDSLAEVEVDGVQPTAQVTGLTNQLRPDVAVAWDESERQALIEPDRLSEGLLKVKKIL